MEGGVTHTSRSTDTSRPGRGHYIHNKAICACVCVFSTVTCNPTLIIEEQLLLLLFLLTNTYTRPPIHFRCIERVIKRLMYRFLPLFLFCYNSLLIVLINRFFMLHCGGRHLYLFTAILAIYAPTQRKQFRIRAAPVAPTQEAKIRLKSSKNIFCYTPSYVIKCCSSSNVIYDRSFGQHVRL